MSLFGMLKGVSNLFSITLTKTGFHSSDNYFVVKYSKKRIKVSLVLKLRWRRCEILTLVLSVESVCLIFVLAVALLRSVSVNTSLSVVTAADYPPSYAGWHSAQRLLHPKKSRHLSKRNALKLNETQTVSYTRTAILPGETFWEETPRWIPIGRAPRCRRKTLSWVDSLFYILLYFFSFIVKLDKA